jgi:hypothetical protein
MSSDVGVLNWVNEFMVSLSFPAQSVIAGPEEAENLAGQMSST